MNPLIQNLIEAACCAKVVEIVRQFNHKMLQLRQKFCQIVTFIVLRSEKCTFCNTACSMFCFDLRLDTEKLRNIKITTKIHSSILIGNSCQSGWDDTYLSNFWYNIKETPDNFNDFSTTKPAHWIEALWSVFIFAAYIESTKLNSNFQFRILVHHHF